MLEAFEKSGVTRRADQRPNVRTLLVELLGNVRAEKS
jgi:hypothetical protein